jgi:multidrug efflux pump subunit AcrA (membrane-fusion protein)
MQVMEPPPQRQEVRPEAPHEAEHHDEIDLNVPEPRPLWLVLAGVLGVLALAALLLTGLIPRQRQNKELQADAAAATDAPVPVEAALPKRSAPVVDVAIPGTLRPWQEVSILARTSGFLKKY